MMAGLSAENPLKDAFRRPTIESWARRLGALDEAFAPADFLEVVFAKWEDLSFGQRSTRIADSLECFLPEDFQRASQLLIQGLDPPLGPDELAPLERFLVWPQTTWVARKGRLTGDFEITAATLREMTMRFSAEGELRVLFELDERRALETLRGWTNDPNPHARRLVSEGTRPRLPLAARWRRFDTDPGPIFELLEKLKDDPSLYVRRSVANNLNDWVKDHPEPTGALLTRWAEGADENRRWVIRHAARTLVKRGHPAALALTGVDVREPWRIEHLAVRPESCRLGGVLEFSYVVVHEGPEPAKATVDFQLGPLPGAPNAKVFKGRLLGSSGGQRFAVEGRRSLTNTSGRTWRPGPHRLAILVNGRVLAELGFELG